MANINLDPEDQWHGEYIICPYCEQTHGDCWEWVKEQPEEMICEGCGGVFTYEADYDVTYIAKPVRPPVAAVSVDEDDTAVVVFGTALGDMSEALVEGVVDVAWGVTEGLGVLVEGVGTVAVEGVGAALEGASAVMEGAGAVLEGVASIFEDL